MRTRRGNMGVCVLGCAISGATVLSTVAGFATLFAADVCLAQSQLSETVTIQLPKGALVHGVLAYGSEAVSIESDVRAGSAGSSDLVVAGGQLSVRDRARVGTVYAGGSAEINTATLLGGLSVAGNLNLSSQATLAQPPYRSSPTC